MVGYQKDSKLEKKVEAWRPDRWQEIPSVIRELSQGLVVILSWDIALYNEAKTIEDLNDRQIKWMGEELDKAFLKIKGIKEKKGEMYDGSMWHMLHQQYRGYETSIESRMKVESAVR